MLHGAVDARALVGDPQSSIGWFKDIPALAAPILPTGSVCCCAALDRTGRPAAHRLHRRDGADVRRRPALRARHDIEPLGEGLPERPRRDRRRVLVRLFQRPYWNTARLPNDRYLLAVQAWDAAGNRARRDIEIGIANPPV